MKGQHNNNTQKKETMNKFLNKTRRAVATAVGVTCLSIAAASAQTTNAGVGAIETAIEGLKPDMGSIVVAAIGLALIGIGAGVALSLGKKIMGK
jgi:hypothetical protein